MPTYGKGPTRHCEDCGTEVARTPETEEFDVVWCADCSAKMAAELNRPPKCEACGKEDSSVDIVECPECGALPYLCFPECAAKAKCPRCGAAPHPDAYVNATGKKSETCTCSGSETGAKHAEWCAYYEEGK